MRPFAIKPPLGAQISFAHPLAQNLTLAYPFNEGAGPYVFNAAAMQCNPPGPNMYPVGQNIHTTTGWISPGGTNTRWQPGLLGGIGLNFTLTTLENGIDINGAGGSTAGYDTTGKAFSLQAWINYSGSFVEFGSSGGPTVFTQQNSNTDSHWNISIGRTNSHLQRYSGFDSGYTINANKTYHVVYTFDAAVSDTSGTEKFYVNGELVATRTGTVPASVTADSSHIVVIGTSSSGFHPWSGYIDWPCMWVGRVLSPSDVRWLYEEPWGMFGFPPYLNTALLSSTLQGHGGDPGGGDGGGGGGNMGSRGQQNMGAKIVGKGYYLLVDQAMWQGRYNALRKRLDRRFILENSKWRNT